MNTNDALRWAHENDARMDGVMINAGMLPSKVYQALKNDDRIKQTGDGRTVLVFMVPGPIYDEMLLGMEF